VSSLAQACFAVCTQPSDRQVLWCWDGMNGVLVTGTAASIIDSTAASASRVSFGAMKIALVRRDDRSVRVWSE
jgi:hypothetical protein